MDERASVSDHKHEQSNWISLWHTKVPAKLRVFLWRLAKQSLPTTDVLHHRHIAASSSCGICGAVDSWRHSLLDCTMARCVWALADEDMLEHMCQMQDTNARNWLFTMIETLNHDQFTRMSVTLWAIWHARRKAIHEDLFQSPLSTHSFVDSFIAELHQSTKPKPASVRQGVAIPHVAWIAPSAGVAKLNVDAGVARSGLLGSAAAVARSATGEYLGASVVIHSGLSDPETLEALAVREGLNLAQDLQLPRITVASDCLSVVKALKEENLGSYSHIIREIQSSTSGFAETTIVHEGRSSNKEAHNLAQLGVTLPVGRHVWFIDPPDGVCIPRFLSY